MLVCLYVDDLIYTENDDTLLQEFKDSMKAEFEMTDLGMMRYFLGIEVMQSTTGIFITQKKMQKRSWKDFIIKIAIQSRIQLNQD